MTPEISKLKSLYQQLDHQQVAGDDVVAELKKEINNLELSYLKEQVLPQVAQFLASKVRDLRCDIDSSFQFDGQQNINYSFCTSGSMLFIKDSIDINSIPDLKEKISPESNEYSLPLIQSETKTDVVTYSFRIVDYSDIAVALFGDTRLFANDLKKLGGYFNPRLRGGAGWIFSKNKKVALIELLSPYLNEVKSISPTENKLEEQFPNNNPKLSKEEWMNLISSMKCMKHKGYIAPHKAIFILTIIEAIKNKKIVENRIFPSTSLSDIFNRLWCEYVSIDLPFKSNFYQPFIHMEGEPFYYLIRLDGIDKFDINQNWNRNNVLQYVEYGVLNSELFKHLFDEKFSQSLKNKLVEKYLSQQKISNLTTTKNEFKGKKEDNDIFKTFKRYLYTLKSNKGKPYSESSINVFHGALKSKYITEKLLKISGYENLGAVDDIKIINELLSLIFYDYENGSKNIVTYRALKMYRDYYKQNRQDCPSNNT